jgi:hypothetical protein
MNETFTITKKNVMSLSVGDSIVESWHRGKPSLRIVTLPRTEVLSTFQSLVNPKKTSKVIRQRSHLENCCDYGMVHLSTSKGLWCVSRDETFECIE